MNELRLTLLALAVPACGLCLLDLLHCRPTGRLALLGWSCATGLSALLLALYLPLAADGNLHLLPALLLLGIGATWQLVCLAAKGWLPRTASSSPPHWRPRLVHLAALIGLALLIQTVSSAPMRGYDAKAIYGIKAKALDHEGHVRGALFSDPEVVHYHGDYPLGVPLLMAFCARVSEGRPDDPGGLQPAADAQAWSARHDGVERYVPFATLWAVLLVALVGAAARRHARGDIAWLLLLLTALPITLVMPFSAGRSWAWAGADLPLAALVAALTLCVRAQLDTPSGGRLVLVALFAAAALALKNDALLVLAALGGATWLCGPRGRRRGALAALALGGLVALIAVGLGRRFAVGAPYDEHWLAAITAATPARVAARLPALLALIPPVLAERGLALHFAGLIGLALPIGLLRPGASRWLASLILLHLLGSTALFLFSPDVLAWHLSTALPRLWSHAAGPAALLLIDSLAWLWQRPQVGATTPAGAAPRGSPA